MNFNLRGENLNVTPFIEKYISAKIKQYYQGKKFNADIRINKNKNNQSINVVVPFQKKVIKTKKSDSNLYPAIDSAFENIFLQIQKEEMKNKRKTRKEQIKRKEEAKRTVL